MTLNEFIKDIVFEELPQTIMDFKIWLKNNYVTLTEETIDRWAEELYGTGPLKKLIDDQDVTEIIVQGHQYIIFERHGQIEILNDSFLNPLTYRNFIFRVMQEAQIRTDLADPCADGQWRSFRLHLIQKPLVCYDFHLTLRRQQPEAFTLQNLKDKGMLTNEQKSMLEQIVEDKLNAIVVGPTGSGKTTLLNSLLCEAKSDRIVALEDTKELKMPNDKSVSMLTRFDSQGHLKNFDLGDLLRQSLRMRPERLVVGEIRGGEATQLLMALATGHQGSFGTLHAEDPWQALLRLEMLVQMGAPQWAVQSIRQLIWQSVDVIIVVDQQDKIRKLKGIYQIASLEPHGFLLESYRLLKSMPLRSDNFLAEQSPFVPMAAAVQRRQLPL